MQSILHSIVGPAGPEIADLNGKVALVTGGALGKSSAECQSQFPTPNLLGPFLGIGYEISRFFARMGCHVIMANRKEDQGQEAIDKIKAECSKEGKEAKIEWIQLDLGSLKMVKEVVTKLRERLDRLDLVCSAMSRSMGCADDDGDFE